MASIHQQRMWVCAVPDGSAPNFFGLLECSAMSERTINVQNDGSHCAGTSQSWDEDAAGLQTYSEDWQRGDMPSRPCGGSIESSRKIVD